jgi:hypothetical protein
MANDKEIRKQLVSFLTKPNAHATLDNALDGILPEHYGARTPGMPYSIWQLVEHIRIAQWDILDFSRNPDYKKMKWPEDYWPQEAAPKDAQEWENSLARIRSDLKEFIALLEDEDNDLYAPFAWGSGQNLLREAMLIADHNAYHGGQIVLARKMLSDWE